MPTATGRPPSGTEERRLLEVYLAHPESGSVLVLRREFLPDGEGALPDLGRVLRTSTAGHRLSVVACAEVVTESAVRAANRTLHISAFSFRPIHGGCSMPGQTCTCGCCLLPSSCK